MHRLFILALMAAATAGTAGCGAGGTAVPASDAAAETGAQGLMVSLRLGSAGPTLPVIDAARDSITTAALWIAEIDLVSDQGQWTSPLLQSLAFDAGAPLDIALPDAPPGLYSLVRVSVAQATGAPLPAGFAGQPLSIRAAGTLPSSRTFTISDAGAAAVDVRAPAAMELKPGGNLHVQVDIDVAAWLSGLSFDMGNSSEPFVVGPDGNGGFRDDFRSNVLGSFSVSLAQP